MYRVVPLLIVLSLGFAPAPAYRPPLTSQQVASLEKAQGYLAALSLAREKFRMQAEKGDDITAERFDEYRKEYWMLYGKAQTEVVLLIKGLGRRTGRQKIAIAEKMGPAWLKLEVYENALPYFDDIIAHSADPLMQDVAIAGARDCHIGLGHTKDGERLHQLLEAHRLKKYSRVKHPVPIALEPAIPARLPPP
jgi:hypothetical protein